MSENVVLDWEIVYRLKRVSNLYIIIKFGNSSFWPTPINSLFVLTLQFLADVNLRSRSLYPMGRPSVCRLSVTLVRPTQLVEVFSNFFHHTLAQGL